MAATLERWELVLSAPSAEDKEFLSRGFSLVNGALKRAAVH